jgi:hypothetical protein
VAQALDLGAVTAGVKCGRGFGLAVCAALDLIFTSNFDNSTISAYELRGPDHRRLGTWGGPAPGPLHFDFSGGGSSGGMCFTTPAPMAGGSSGSASAGLVAGGDGPAPRASATPLAAAPLLLVASAGTRRVVVLDVGVVARGGAPVPAGAFGAAPDPAPRAVSACPGLVAVSGWVERNAGDHSVTLYAFGTWVKVRVVGVGWGHGPGDGQLAAPHGLCFSTDGVRLLVADPDNHRVCAFRVADGAFVGVLASKETHGLSRPRDVVEVPGGLLVADTANHRLVRVPSDGSPMLASGGVEGSKPGQFALPTALFVSSDGAQVIVREFDGDRFQVFCREVRARRKLAAFASAFET